MFEGKSPLESIFTFQTWCRMTKLTPTSKASHTLVIIILCFIFLPFSSARYFGDVEALIALRNSLLPKREILPSWFDSKIPPCNWTGVKCEGAAVFDLDLSCTFLPLNLPFPNLLGEFRSLKHLNLSHCGLTGSIPPNIWSLDKLETLNLSDNRLDGVLPPTLSNLKNLRELVLDDNNFSGSLPSTIGNLEELTELSVHANLFSGNLPEEMGNLQKLQSLDLSVNLFSENLPSV